MRRLSTKFRRVRTERSRRAGCPAPDPLSGRWLFSGVIAGDFVRRPHLAAAEDDDLFVMDLRIAN